MAQKNILTNYTIVAGVEGQSTIQALSKQLDGLSFSAKKLSKDLQASSGSSGLQQVSRDAKSAKNSVNALSSALDDYRVKIAVGIVAAQQFAKTLVAILEVQGRIDQLKIGLDLVNDGNTRKIADDLEFLKDVTNRLGLEFNQTSELYTKFAAATKESGFTAAEARDVFDSFAGATARLSLSTDSASRVFFALQQIVSKGTVSSEELKNQLGEKIPGVMAIAAKAFDGGKGDIEAFNKALADGKVKVDDFLIPFADGIRESLGVASGESVNTATAAFGRFKNSYEDLLRAVVDSGLGDFVVELFDGATSAIGGASEAIRDLKADTQDFFNAIDFEALQLLAEVFVGLKGASVGAATGASIGSIIPGLGTAAGAAIGAGVGYLGGAGATNEVINQARFGKQEDFNKLLSRQVEIEKQILEVTTRRDSRYGKNFLNQKALTEEIQALQMEGLDIDVQIINSNKQVSDSVVAYKNEMAKSFAETESEEKEIERERRKREKAAADAADKSLKQSQALQKEIQNLIKQETLRSEVLTAQIALGRELTDTEKKYIEDVKKFGKLQADRLKAMREENDVRKEGIDLRKEEAKFTGELERAAKEELRGYQKRTEQLEDEIQRIGLKTEALAELEAQALATQAAEARSAAEDVGGFNPQLYQDRISQAEELEKLALLVRKKAAKEAADAIVEENRNANIALVDDIIKTFGDIATQGGKEAGKNIVKAIQVELQKAVFKVGVQAVLGIDEKGNTTGGGLSGLLGTTANQSISSAIQSGFSQVASSAGAALFGSASAYAAAVPGLTSAAAGSQAALLAAQTGSFGAAGTAATAAAGGSAAAGAASSALASAGPYIAAAIIAYNLFKKDKISATDLGPDQTKPIQDAIYLGFDATLKQLGGTGSILSNVTGNTGRQGQNANFSVRGTGYSSNDFFGGDGLFAAGEIALNEQNINEQVTRAIFAGLRESDFADNIDALFDSIDPVAASFESLGLALQGVQVLDFVNDNFAALESNLKGLAGASLQTIEGFLSATGGLENLNSMFSGFVETFYTESERFDLSVQSATKAIADLNLVVPQTREAFRALVEAQDLTTESGQRAYASLLSMSGAVGTIFDQIDTRAKESADEAKRAADEARQEQERIINERLGLEGQILQLMGNTAELRRRELEALDPANRAYQEHIYLLEDARDAQDKRNAALESEKDALQRLVDAGRSIKDVINQITLGLNTTPQARTQAAGALFDQQLTLARGNDTNALGSIGGAATAAIDAARSSSRSFVEFQRQALKIRADLQSLPAVKSFEEQLLIAIQDLKIDLTKFLGSSGVLVNSISDGFSKIDGNLDGKLTFDELKLALGDKATDAELRKIFTELDSNGDGVISRLEALNGKTQSLAGAIKDGLSPLFGKIDTSLNGLIDPAEFTVAFASFGLGPKIDTLRQAFDFNNDKQISAIEALGVKVVSGDTLAKNAIDFGFASLDTSVDGLLNLDELKAGLGAFIKDADIVALLKNIDTDGNGQISAIEAQTARIGALAVEIRNNLSPLFDSIDTNVSGGISKEEFSQVFGGLGLGQKLDSIFSELDLNGDGTISRLEAGNRTSDQILGQLASDSILKYSAADVRAAYVSGGKTLAQWLEVIAGQGGASSAVSSAGSSSGSSGGSVSSQPAINQPFLEQAIQSLNGAADSAKGGFYKYAVSRGLTDSGINGAIGQILGDQFRLSASDFAYLNNIGDINQYTGPRFAKGGNYMGGMALVGEEGPELINFNRGGRVYNARDTMRMMNIGVDMSGVINELKSVKAELATLRQENRVIGAKIAENTGKTSSQLDDVINGAESFTTVPMV